MIIELFLVFQIILFVCFIASLVLNNEILMGCSTTISIFLMLLTGNISNMIYQKMFFFINAGLFLISIIFIMFMFIDKYSYSKTHNKIGGKKCY